MIPATITVIRWLCAAISVVFIILGAAKLWDLRSFAEAIEQWQAIPRSAVPVVTMLAPVSEIIAGGAWFILGFRNWRCFCVPVLMLVFMAALIVEATMGGNGTESCGCFGRLFEAPTMPLWARIGLNAIIAIPFLALYACRNRA